MGSDSGRLRAIFDAPLGSYADNAGLAFSSNGRRLAYSVSGQHAGVAVLWDADSGMELSCWKLPPGLQNVSTFAGPERLLHFQVETLSGSALPEYEVHWRQHPRVGRIRNLKADEPATVVAEMADFECKVYLALGAQDGKHLVVEGTRAIKEIRTG